MGVNGFLDIAVQRYGKSSIFALQNRLIMPKAKSSVEIKNRRASFDYEFIETFQAGIVLTGTEIKAIRAGKASLVDTFCYFNSNEL